MLKRVYLRNFELASTEEKRAALRGLSIQLNAKDPSIPLVYSMDDTFTLSRWKDGAAARYGQGPFIKIQIKKTGSGIAELIQLNSEEDLKLIDEIYAYCIKKGPTIADSVTSDIARVEAMLRFASLTDFISLARFSILDRELTRKACYGKLPYKLYNRI